VWRPESWSEVKLKVIPLMDDEEGYGGGNEVL
jgi:hypothetical protein